MKPILILSISFLLSNFYSCKKDSDKNGNNSFDSFCSIKPTNWTCDVYQNSFDSLPIPDGLGKPLAIVKYLNTKDSFISYSKKDKLSLYLQVYNISKKDSIEKVIAKMIVQSSCIPTFYGENDKYYVITSPCFVNGGCFTQEADSLIKPLHQALNGLFTKSNTTLIK